MAMVRESVGLEADSWEATKTALSAFKQLWFRILLIYPVECCFAQCWLVIHPENKHRRLEGRFMND